MVGRVIRRPALILALLTAINLLNYLDRLVLSAVLAKVQDDLHLSNFAGGSLFTIFLIGYFATSPVFGNLADRAQVGGRKRLLGLGIAVWSLATIGTGLSHDTLSLVVARALVGVGEASYATIAPTFIDEIAPPETKGRWMAIFYSATPIGSALGYIVGGSVEHATGSWRAAFFVAGVPGLLLAALCLLVTEPARQTQSKEALPNVLGSFRTLLLQPLYVRTCIGYCAYTFGLGGFAAWAPKYLHARYGLETGSASSAFGGITVVAGAVGTLVGGYFGDLAARKMVARTGTADWGIARGNLDVCAWSAAVGAPLAAVAIVAATATGFFAGAFPSEIGLFLLSGPVNVAILRSVPVELRASAMALAIFAIHLLGDLWSPPLIGLVADHAPMQWAMFGIPAALALAALAWAGGTRVARPPRGLTFG
jgi:MFS transporter, Spinster family, sphingosine-1-phosphate transporter